MPVSVLVESMRDVVPGLIEPEVEPVVPVVVAPDVVPDGVPELIEPEVEPVVPAFGAFVVPEVAPGLVVALPEGFGFDVEPEFTEPLLFVPGPELEVEDVPPVEPLVPVPPVPPDCAYETAATLPMAIAAAMESVREVDMVCCFQQMN